MGNTHVEIQENKLSLDVCFQFIHDPKCGGNCFFVGTVRNKSTGKEVVQLDFEAYEPMALKEMQAILDEAVVRFDIHKAYIAHRIGDLKISDIAVIIGVSSVHRDSSFKACAFIIDTLRETVPIWKKEHFLDGISWVNAHP